MTLNKRVERYACQNAIVGTNGTKACPLPAAVAAAPSATERLHRCRRLPAKAASRGMDSAFTMEAYASLMGHDAGHQVHPKVGVFDGHVHGDPTHQCAPFGSPCPPRPTASVSREKAVYPLPSHTVPACGLLWAGISAGPAQPSAPLGPTVRPMVACAVAETTKG